MELLLCLSDKSAMSATRVNENEQKMVLYDMNTWLRIMQQTSQQQFYFFA